MIFLVAVLNDHLDKSSVFIAKKKNLQFNI